MATEDKTESMLEAPKKSSIVKVRKSITKNLPPLKLDLDDLQEIENILIEHRGNEFVITAVCY